jgi:hypothetical protein
MRCDRCDGPLPAHGGYEVAATPSTPREVCCRACLVGSDDQDWGAGHVPPRPLADGGVDDR